MIPRRIGRRWHCKLLCVYLISIPSCLTHLTSTYASPTFTYITTIPLIPNDRQNMRQRRGSGLRRALYCKWLTYLCVYAHSHQRLTHNQKHLLQLFPQQVNDSKKKRTEVALWVVVCIFMCVSYHASHPWDLDTYASPTPIHITINIPPAECYRLCY